MKIAIIGSGQVGSALAKGWSRVGHEVIFGVRDPDAFKGKELLAMAHISAAPIREAASQAAVIVIAAVPQAVQAIARDMGDVGHAVIIDAMNSVRAKPTPYENTTEALSQLTNCNHIVKCFNTTGAENMADPVYGGEGVDMFYAGDSDHGKQVAKQLALDLGFSQVYDFGGSAQYNLLEALAASWINLALVQGYGRNIAFRVVRR